MVPSCPYIYAFIHGIILPSSSTFKICTFSPIRMQSTHQQDFCSLANVGKRTCRNCMHSMCCGPEFFSAAMLGFESVLPIQSSGFTKSNWEEKENYWRERGRWEGKENLQRGHNCWSIERGGWGPGLWPGSLAYSAQWETMLVWNSRKLLINSDSFWLPWVLSSCGSRAQECWLISCGTWA